MAQSLARVKHRISAVESTRKITNSMKLVSSVKLRKMNKTVTLQAFYFKAMERALSDAIFYNNVNADNSYDSIYLKENNESKKKLYIIVCSNMGLCGAYNNDVIKYFKKIYKKGDEIIIIGEKGYLNLQKEKDLKIETKFLHLRNDFTLGTTRVLCDFIMSKYETGEFNEISMVYLKYKNSISFVPTTLKLLPLIPKENKGAIYSPIYEPSKEKVLEIIIPQYLNSLLYGNLYSAFLSEESSRRNSMDAADKSAKDLVDKLTLEYNKARQQEITQEITEVVNGSKAVK